MGDFEPQEKTSIIEHNNYRSASLYSNELPNGEDFILKIYLEMFLFTR